jgi:diguanylate cyclase (GGDEF)-like protein/PAS domain S-box-containing protein
VPIRKYQALFERNPQPVFVWEKETGRILAVNRSGCQAYGFSQEELQGMTCFDLRMRDAQSQGMPLPQAGTVVERVHLRRDGTKRECEVHTSDVTWQGKRALLSLVVDVTERNEHQRQAQRISRFYAVACKVSRTIFGLDDETAVLQAACDIAVRTGAFGLAWIGIPDPQTGLLSVAAQAGSALEYLRNIRVSIRGHVPEGLGPLGTAMRENRIVAENDFLNSSSGAPWRDEASRYGLRALLCAPIVRNEEVVAGLGLYGSEVGMFGATEIRLIAELTADIALALDDLDRKRRLLAQERVADLTTRVYELIASDAPLRTVFDRLAEIVAERTPHTHANIVLLPHGDATLTPSDVAVPITAADGRTLGFLRLSRDGSFVPTDDELAFFLSLAQLASIAVERHAARERLEHQALHDSLTDLPNRLLFDDRLAQALAATRRRSTLVAVGLVDLDRFKVINDTLGHAQGDLLLRAASERFRACLRADETVARMGGDEFLVIFTDLRHSNEAEIAARRLLATLEQPFRIGAREIFVRASLGMVVADSAQTELVGDLLQRADRAMYRAKRSGAGYIMDTGTTPSIAQTEDLDLESDLHRALQRKEFVLHYQPFYDGRSGKIVACEALLRWLHPHRGMLSPDAFVPIAEVSGLIVPIGEWTLQAACQQAALWARRGIDIPISINISARQFAQPGLERSVVQALAQSGVAPDRLWLEVTETSVMDSPGTAASVLAELKGIGAHIAIDDFGIGYSSLAYLHRFPIDMLKIDRSFVSGVSPGRSGNGMEIARSIVALANGLGVDVLAEGVETEEQRDALLHLGCHLMQGFLLSHPLPPQEVWKVLAESTERSDEREALI